MKEDIVLGVLVAIVTCNVHAHDPKVHFDNLDDVPAAKEIDFIGL